MSDCGAESEAAGGPGVGRLVGNVGAGGWGSPWAAGRKALGIRALSLRLLGFPLFPSFLTLLSVPPALSVRGLEDPSGGAAQEKSNPIFRNVILTSKFKHFPGLPKVTDSLRKCRETSVCKRHSFQKRKA